MPAKLGKMTANIAKNPSSHATYELYDRATGALIASNSFGVFILQKVPANREVYNTYTFGPCTSAEGRRHKGNPFPVGTHYWIIDDIDLHDKPLIKTGSVNPIR